MLRLRRGPGSWPGPTAAWASIVSPSSGDGCLDVSTSRFLGTMLL